MSKNKSSRSGCLTFLVRAFIALVLVVALLLTAGYFYQCQITAADFEQFPAPGQRVDVGGYCLHNYCMGEGSPTVFEKWWK